MIKRRQEELRKCQVKIDRNGRSENANACRYNYYAEEGEAEKIAKKSKTGKKCIYTQDYFYVYLQEAEGSENGHRPCLPQLVEEGSAVGVYSSFLKENNILKREKQASMSGRRVQFEYS